MKWEGRKHWEHDGYQQVWLIAYTCWSMRLISLNPARSYLLGWTIIWDGTIQWNFLTEVGIIAVFLMGSLCFLLLLRGKGGRKPTFTTPTITFNEAKWLRQTWGKTNQKSVLDEQIHCRFIKTIISTTKHKFSWELGFFCKILKFWLFSPLWDKNFFKFWHFPPGQLSHQ